jgi:hypothetical protein
MVDLATDILDGKVFTSRHIWVMCGGDENKWLKDMAAVFSSENVIGRIKELKEMCVADLFDGVMFYQYIDKSQIPFDKDKINEGAMPFFKEIEFIYGQDVKDLDTNLKTMYKERLN